MHSSDMFRKVRPTGAATMILVGTLPMLPVPAVAQCAATAPGFSADTPRASPSDHDGEATQEYWTDERMRDATPMPMPSPEPPSPPRGPGETALPESSTR
ncbi:MAG: hypothetical protein ACR2M4_13755 [Actinomycetota bacterium]